MIYDSKNYLYYYRLTPDGRMLFGGRAAFFPENDQTVRRSAEILRRGMIDVYPQLSDAKVEYVWGGTLDFAFDIMPHAGQIDGMYYAVGYAGHGVAMATYQGQKIAELIAAEKPLGRLSTSRRIRLWASRFRARRSGCTTGSRGSCRSRERGTSFWIG